MVTTAFNNLKKSSVKYTKVQLNSKNSELKAKWKTVQELLAVSGFGWNSLTKTVTAESDAWSRYTLHAGTVVKSSSTVHEKSSKYWITTNMISSFIYYK